MQKKLILTGVTAALTLASNLYADDKGAEIEITHPLTAGNSVSLPIYGFQAEGW
jgi:hypothetical protein